MTAAIAVEKLARSFQTTIRPSGFGGTLRSLLRPERRAVEAVRGVSFTIEAGERVSFIGPNGAGKSTTIKMLSGILHPSAGTATVLGLTPWKQRGALGHQIGTVFGQRSRLWFHLPASDAFELLSRVYDLDRAAYRRRLGELSDLFQLGDLASKPVRTLSLGERMRCELVACLLHSPRVLFLDEPTIGLDVVAKATLRDLVRDLSEREGLTVLLTSHDTGDMERVCDRVLVINHGELLLDHGVNDLRRTYLKRKIVILLSEDEWLAAAFPGATVVARQPHRTVIEVDTTVTTIEAVVQAVLRETRLKDLTVEDPPMDEIVRSIYQQAQLKPSDGSSA